MAEPHDARAPDAASGLDAPDPATAPAPPLPEAGAPNLPVPGATGNPAGRHPVRLDPFQEEAERLLEAGYHVLVSAPTGAGKSLIAERLADRACQRGQGFIYTGPIKALINQKFRDFCRPYGHERVGIITGDVVIRDTAPLLVMTTEIFRNMAVARPESLAGYHYLVLDEVHYLDSDRGAAWEESIIFAPPHLQILALSATVANAQEIADWIADVTGRPTHVVREDRRPVPLAIHYSGPSGHITDFEGALDELTRLAARARDRFGLGERSAHIRVVRQVARRRWLPCLYFVFSRAGCEHKARELAWELDLLDDEERARVRAHLQGRESDTLRGSGTWRLLRDCLFRGIAFHHAGMLPEAKELVEELYELGLVKVLYCTETFAVGVNFPVRSAIFDGARKFDGEDFRPLTALEFHQMAGRAGRRGIDRQGHAILVLQQQDLPTAQDYAQVKPEPVVSRLVLRPNTVLNLVATRTDSEIRALLTRSLKVFQARRAARRQEERLEAIRQRLAEVQAQLCAAAGTVGCPAVRAPLEARRQELERELAALAGQDTPRARRVRRQREAELAEVERRLAEAPLLPHTPEQEEACRRLTPEWAHLQTDLRRQEKKARQGLKVEQELLDQFDRLRAELEQLGYIEGNQLLPRGMFAREVHVEEVAVTELYFNGFFHKAREEEICAVITALAYDGKEQMDTLPKKLPSHLKDALATVRRYAANFNRGVYAPAYDWARGRDFILILREYAIAEGDLVSALRRGMDLLRQIRRAAAQDPVRDKIERCLARLDRPPVRVELE